MHTAIVAGVDTPPVLELSEHIFDVVSLAIEDAVYLAINRVELSADPVAHPSNQQPVDAAFRPIPGGWATTAGAGHLPVSTPPPFLLAIER